MTAESVIISVEELSRRINEGVILLDARTKLTDETYGRAAYEEGHIPGARFVDTKTDVSGVMTGTNGRHPMPARQDLLAAMRRLGVTRTGNPLVVVYDDGDMTFSARVWMSLLWLGFSNCRVLDGGYKAWLKAGLATETKIPVWQPGDLDEQESLVRIFLVNEIVENLQTKRFVLVDARTRERWRGETEPLDAKAGSIPNSLNRPSSENFTPEGVFKSAQTLRSEFQALLPETALDRVVHYCGSGVSACCNLLAMAYAGLPLAGLYVGSWSEWISDPTRPLGQGDRN